MILKKWEKLPTEMQTEEVRAYYEVLSKRRASLFLKRFFDLVMSLTLLLLLSPVFVILAIAIKIDTKGPVFYRQERVTQYGRRYRIFKFRTMKQGADTGSLVTVKNDARITRVGKFIRKCRLDEVSQLLDVLRGTMTFVGTRPEVPKYVAAYSKEMWATLLLPAGITSEASILYKDEDKLLDGAEDTDRVYVEEVLPVKMYYNLKAIKKFSLWRELSTMLKTVFAMLGKKYEGDYEEGKTAGSDYSLSATKEKEE